MELLRVRVTMEDKPPDRKPLAGALFDEMIRLMAGDAFADPELEAEFREWQQERASSLRPAS